MDLSPVVRGTIVSRGETPANVSGFEAANIDNIGPGNTDPIGIGTACLIRIEAIYTGRFGSLGWFKRAMLLTSSLRKPEQQSAPPRKLNFLEPGIAKQSLITQPSPAQPGSKLIYYSPSLTRLKMDLSLEMAIDDVDQSTFEGLSSLLSSAGQLAIFIPYAGFALFGAQLINLIGRFGNNLLDATAEWSANLAIDLTPASGKPITSGIFFGMEEPEWGRLKSAGHRLNQYTLVAPDGQPYKGDEPYVVLSIDARPDPELNGFQLADLTADVSARFLSGASRNATTLELVQGLLEIGNDYTFYEKATALNKSVQQLTAELAAAPDDKKAAIQLRLDQAVKERDAQTGNIRNPDRKPKF